VELSQNTYTNKIVTQFYKNCKPSRRQHKNVRRAAAQQQQNAAQNQVQQRINKQQQATHFTQNIIILNTPLTDRI
jgi:hypothetical protein